MPTLLSGIAGSRAARGSGDHADPPPRSDSWIMASRSNRALHLQGLRLDIEHTSIGANRQTQTRGIDPQVQIVAARGIKATGCEGLRKDLQALRAKRTGRGKGSEGAAVHAAGDVGGGNVVTRAISKRIDGGKVGEQVHFGAAAA